MRFFTYTNNKITAGIDTSLFQNDGSFKTDVSKTGSFRVFAPISWSDDNLFAAIKNKSNRNILLTVYVELTNSHDKKGTSVLPADCFLISIPIADKPLIQDSQTMPLCSNGIYGLYICYSNTTTIQIGSDCIKNTDGTPTVVKYKEKAVATSITDDVHVFEF